MHDVRILHISVAAPLAEAYAFAHRPEAFMEWAAGLAKTLHHTERGWVADTPAGEAVVRFSPPNDFGVLDHWVAIAGRPEMYMPLRMVANADGCEVELVLFRQPEMSDADFERDAEMVRADLLRLKAVLETRAAA